MKLNSLDDFVEKANAISRSEYAISLEALVQELNTERGRLRYGRLLGVMLKEPFADRIARSQPSEATGAAYNWSWNEQKVRDHLSREAWQYAVLKCLVAEKSKNVEPSREDIYRFLQYEGVLEGRIFKYLFEATHRHICGNEKARRQIKAAVEKARKDGAKIADPSRTNLVAGIAAVATAMVAALGPYGVALGPLAGGIALLIAQIGLDAFCMWSHDKLDEIRQTEKQEEFSGVMALGKLRLSPWAEETSKLTVSELQTLVSKKRSTKPIAKKASTKPPAGKSKHK
jgi:hypothetical protein